MPLFALDTGSRGCRLTDYEYVVRLVVFKAQQEFSLIPNVVYWNCRHKKICKGWVLFDLYQYPLV